MARPGFDDPQWFRRAVFYEVFLRGFADSSGDGNGDLRGLTERLDHLDWLGVDCVWLLPFYASPLRDGGYDISDFFTVHPTYGVLADVIELVDEVVLVDDDEIQAAMGLIADSLGVLVEPAGAAGVAAASRHPEQLSGERVAVLLTGAAG